MADTLAPSYVERTSISSGEAGNAAERIKRAKYRDLPATHELFPIGFETLGGLGDVAKEFLEDIKAGLRIDSGDPRSGDFFIQRLSLHIVRGNAACVIGSMINSRTYDLEEVSTTALD